MEATLAGTPRTRGHANPRESPRVADVAVDRAAPRRAAPDRAGSLERACVRTVCNCHSPRGAPRVCRGEIFLSVPACAGKRAGDEGAGETTTGETSRVETFAPEIFIAATWSAAARTFAVKTSLSATRISRSREFRARRARGSFQRGSSFANGSNR